jgi:S1-C subfamily serine protease
MANQAFDLSNQLAASVEAAAPGVVGIARRRGWGATGTVYNRDGLIVAANHAIVGDSGSIISHSGERRDVEVIGRDAGTDIAVLKAESSDGLEPVEFRALDGLKVGNATLALGRPGKSVRASLRIIGVLGPQIRTPGGGRLERYVETDRGFPRGFSGGPLIDIDGKAIGINTSHLIRGADITVPAVTLSRIVDELVAHGAIRRGYLGVGVQRIRLPRPIRQQLGRRSGVLVVGVEDDSPAAKAGLSLGDTILSLAGKPIRSPDELRLELSDHAGDTVTAQVLRTGAILDVEISIGERGR